MSFQTRNRERGVNAPTEIIKKRKKPILSLHYTTTV
jgi:hypothetical protein